MPDRRSTIIIAVLLVLLGAGVAWKLSAHSTALGDTGQVVDPATATKTAGANNTTPTTASAAGANNSTGANGSGTATAGLTGATGSAATWQNQLATIVGIENYLFKNPDPGKVGTYMDPTCSCYGDTVARLTTLQSKNWHVAGDSETIKSTSFVTGTDTSVTAIVTLAPAGNPTVDANGKTIEAAITGTPQPQVYVLDKGQDGVWRINDRHPLPELGQ